MSKLIRKLSRLAERGSGPPESGVAQKENAPSGEGGCSPRLSGLARQCAAEGSVLLKNDGTLPLDPEKQVAVFGRCQLDWFYVGYGSGGDVNAPYYVNLVDGLRQTGAAYDKKLAGLYASWCSSPEHAADHGYWGHWPMSHEEMPLDGSVIQEAAEKSGTALVVIGRAAGEDRENLLEKGSYYLTDRERDLLERVSRAFSRTVVILNAGNVIDMSWTEDRRLSAVLLAWQGGMESGRAVCDVLYGKTNPCGKLSATIAREYADYPSSGNFGGEEYNDYAEGVFVGYRHFDRPGGAGPLFPFGYGLSYTSFDISPVSFSRSGGVTEVAVRVTNTGGVPGREVVQLWCSLPAGGLEKPVRVLAGFAKTSLLEPGGGEDVRVACDDRCVSSFDESRLAFILERGEYRFCANGVDCGGFELDDTAVIEKCRAIFRGPEQLRERILGELPPEIPASPAGDLSLKDAAGGKITLEEFVSGLSDTELEALTRGEGPMDSRLGAPGNAGALGGVIPSLREKGVYPLICADGPAGLRLKRNCALLPCGTALACTWDAEAVQELYSLVAEEMEQAGVDIFLGPGLNIHRNPLCGRNFEYFSENPLLSGKIAAAVVRGIQSRGRACCPKHFACNNQETYRTTNDSRVSQRALREIYLRGFEICVKEGRPKTIMTSYNKINGVWSHYSYDLATTVLRGEWGFDGAVITDWWMRPSSSPEFPEIRDNAYRVRAQVDVLMPGGMSRDEETYVSDGTLLPTLGKAGGITRGELQRTALNVLRLVVGLKYGRPEQAAPGCGG